VLFGVNAKYNMRNREYCKKKLYIEAVIEEIYSQDLVYVFNVRAFSALYPQVHSHYLGSSFRLSGFQIFLISHSFLIFCKFYIKYKNKLYLWFLLRKSAICDIRK